MDDKLLYKIEQSLKFFRSLHKPDKQNILCFSGGKDSIVLYDLAIKSNLNFEYVYANPTIDPPGHISFIRHNFPVVSISHPKHSFFTLIKKIGLPTRHTRFCCQYLKEYVGKGANCFEGIRKDESVNRFKRTKNLYEPSVCDIKVKGKIHNYPILNWSSHDIWAYINHFKLVYPVQYDHGFTRLGCIGCPCTTKKQRLFEFRKYPKIAFAIICDIKKNIDNKGSISKYFSDPYAAFAWWMSYLSVDSFNELQLFSVNYEQIVLDSL